MNTNSILEDDPALPPVLPHHRACVRQLPAVEAQAIERRVIALEERTCGCVPKSAFLEARVWDGYDHDARAEDPQVAAEGARRVRKWLFECGIPFAQDVVVGDYGGEVVATTWKVFVRYWPRFLWTHGLEDIYVTDRSTSWMLGCCHEDTLSFGTRRAVRARGQRR